MRPEDIADLQEWVMRGVLPDQYLYGVLCNSLRDVLLLTRPCDDACIRDTVRWLREVAPRGCWGNSDDVAAWRGLEAMGLCNPGEEFDPWRARTKPWTKSSKFP